MGVTSRIERAVPAQDLLEFLLLVRLDGAAAMKATLGPDSPETINVLSNLAAALTFSRSTCCSTPR